MDLEFSVSKFDFFSRKKKYNRAISFLECNITNRNARNLVLHYCWTVAMVRHEKPDAAVECKLNYKFCVMHLCVFVCSLKGAQLHQAFNRRLPTFSQLIQRVYRKVTVTVR
jgi:hypothetical protein